MRTRIQPLKKRHVTGNRHVVQRGDGYSLISRVDGPDVLVHYSETDGYGFRSLEDNQQAEFEVTQGPKGRRATHVRAA